MTGFIERRADYPPFETRPASWPAIVLQCVAVLEVDKRAVDQIKALIARHRLPRGAVVTKTHEGVWQIWFLLHSGWMVGGNPKFPQGVRLKWPGAPSVADRTTPAPVQFEANLPERLWNLELPEPPFWLLELADIRKAPIDRALQAYIRSLAKQSNKTEKSRRG